MLLEQERWERTKLEDYPTWSRGLASVCKYAMYAVVLIAGWHGFIAAAIAGTTSMWLTLGLMMYLLAAVFIVGIGGRSLWELLASIGPLDSLALFFAPFVNQLLVTEPTEYASAVIQVFLFLLIPRAVVFVIRVRRFV